MAATLLLYFNGAVIMHMSKTHLRFHTPRKSGDHAWKIVDSADNNRVIDSYTPTRRTRPTPITSYKGSWAESLAVRKHLI